MIKLDAVFQATEALTPQLAARLADCAEHHRAELSIEYDGRQVKLNSLISILARNLYRGVPVRVIAEGEDEAAAAEAVRAVVEGKA